MDRELKGKIVVLQEEDKKEGFWLAKVKREVKVDGTPRLQVTWFGTLHTDMSMATFFNVWTKPNKQNILQKGKPKGKLTRGYTQWSGVFDKDQARCVVKLTKHGKLTASSVEKIRQVLGREALAQTMSQQ